MKTAAETVFCNAAGNYPTGLMKPSSFFRSTVHNRGVTVPFFHKIFRAGAAKSAIAVFSLLLFGLLSLTQQASAQIWPRESRTTYLRLGVHGFDTDAYFNADGEKIPLHRLEAQTYSLYSEYGYSRYVTAVVNVPAYRKLLVQETAGMDAVQVESPGDIDLGLRISIYAGRHDIMFLSGVFGIPLGETANTGGLWSGDDEYDQLAMVGYAHAFASLNSSVSLAGGYHFRSGGYSDAMRIDAAADIHPIAPVQLLLRFRSVTPQGNGARDFTGGSYGFAANNREYIMLGADLTFWITGGFGLHGSLHSYHSAKNVSADMMFSTGIVFQFRPTAVR